jgi:hypothetical protein
MGKRLIIGYNKLYHTVVINHLVFDDLELNQEKAPKNQTHQCQSFVLRRNKLPYKGNHFSKETLAVYHSKGTCHP